MKKYIVFVILLWLITPALSQEKPAATGKSPVRDAGRTLAAATSQCALSLLFGTAAAVLVSSDLDDPGERMFFGVMSGGGAAGIGLHSVLLTGKAARQINRLDFLPEDSSRKVRILKNVRVAQTLAAIQQGTILLGVVAGVLNYQGKKNTDYTDDFWASSDFWTPIILSYCIAIALNIPEIVLIENARTELKSCRPAVTLRPSRSGLGFVLNF